MGKRPGKKYSLDRIDNNAGYSKENCRWATMAEQSRNRRDIHLIEYNGEKLCLLDWASRLKVDRGSIYSRLNKGETPQEAIGYFMSTLDKRRPNGGRITGTGLSATFDGRTQNIPAWAKELGVTNAAVYGHIKKGLTPNEAIEKIKRLQERRASLHGGR
jgi:predicted DNA-binding protein YlxM (UPF0122 family)